MPNGFGRGRGGWGFGFRGSSPPWPFVGIGRGGLPRCGYFLSGAAGAPGYMPYPGASPYYGGSFPGAAPYYGSPQAVPFYGGAPGGTTYPGAAPFAPPMSRE